MENKTLIEMAHKGDKRARDILVQENIGLVWSIVKRFGNRGFELEDLFQIGSIGLLKAVDKFDLSYDVKFSTYAVPMIAGEIKRFLRDDGMLKVSRSIKENQYRIYKMREKLEKNLVREPTVTELAEELGIGEITLTDIMKELEKPGRDPRDDMPKPILRSDVLDMKDLKPGMILKGTVRNVIDFGVFVDIGVHQDGLVHISQITDRYIKHPLEAVSVGDIVDVQVLTVDVAKKRIGLTMKIQKQ